MKTKALWLLFFAAITPLVAQEDNFDDGDSNGWTELDPLGGLGAGPILSFAVTDGEYRMTSVSSPNPSLAGPARGGALREEVTYSAGQFFCSVDIPAYDASLEQAFGFLTLVQPNPSLGTTDAYAFTYQPISNDIQISVIIDEEIAVQLTNVDLPVTPGPALRLVFSGSGGSMEGAVYNLDDLKTPLATAFAFDNRYTEGPCGLVVTGNDAAAMARIDATFDNYVANESGLPALEFTRQEDGMIEVRYPDWALRRFLDRSTTLREEEWEFVPNEEIVVEDGYFKHLADPSVDETLFFRLF